MLYPLYYVFIVTEYDRKMVKLTPKLKLIILKCIDKKYSNRKKNGKNMLIKFFLKLCLYF